MPVDVLVREAEGLPENLIMNVVSYMRFLKLEADCFNRTEEDENPNDETIAAMKEYYEMKSHPERYKRYPSFKAAMKEVLEDA